MHSAAATLRPALHTLALLACLVGSARLGFAQGLSQDRPMSVLVIMGDQHNPRALGCYGNGYGGLQQSLTPNLDALASQGTRFTNAFCSQPQCNPSRVSLITGRYPHSHGVRWNGVWEPKDMVTLPRLARAAGYATATIGKHHFSWLDQAEPLEDDLGFDLVVDMPEYAEYCQSNGKPVYTDLSVTSLLPSLTGSLVQTGWTTNANRFHPMGFWADETIAFLEARAGVGGDQRPFVCFYSMYGPHTPILPSAAPGETDWAHLHFPYQALALPPNVHRIATTARLAGLQTQFSYVVDLAWRQVLALYYGFISQMDANIGRVLARLDELGLSESTMVIYTADHGDMSAEMDSWTKGGGNYDAVARVPLIIRLPSALSTDRIRDELTSNVDLLPTILELTGLPITDADRARLEGASLADALLKGRNPRQWRSEVVIEFGHPGVPTTSRQRTIRSRTRKLSVDDLSGGQAEYYDLASDPYEIVDLATAPSPGVQAEIVEMRNRLEQWWGDESTHAPLWVPTGGSRSLPARATEPWPAPGAVGVPRDVRPRFLPATSAGRIEVFLGTTPQNLVLAQSLGSMADTFVPGPLLPSTTYYWRVDGLNPHGRRTGNVWSFTTQADATVLPSLPSLVSPADGARDVPNLTRLRWNPSPEALSQVVWFGPTDERLQRVGADLAPDVDRLFLPRYEGGREFAWRVDSVGAEGTTIGRTWTFRTTADGLPGRATPVYPLHFNEVASQLLTGSPLVWSPGEAALEHRVYLGKEQPLAYQGSTTGPTWAPGTLERGRTYYWRVDEVNEFGVTVGSTWRFTLPK